MYLLGELLGEYHKIETLKSLNIYISAYSVRLIGHHHELHETEVSLISMNMKS